MTFYFARRWSLHTCAACLFITLLSLIIVSANAASVVDRDRHRTAYYVGVYDRKRYIFHVTVNPMPASSCTLNTAEWNRLKTDFSTWEFVNLNYTLPGTFDVLYYDAGLAEQVGNTLVWEPAIKWYFQVDYNNGGEAPTLMPGDRFAWIQFIYTNAPAEEGLPSPYIDPQPNDDTMPFYHTDGEMSNNLFVGQPIYNRKTDVNITFYDRPARPFEKAVELKTLLWEAHLYLVIWDPTDPGLVLVYAVGVKWGFKIWAQETDRPIPVSTVKYTHGGVGGDKMEWTPGPHLNSTAAVGGYSVLITRKDKSILFDPYIISASAILVVTVATTMYVKSIGHKKDKD